MNVEEATRDAAAANTIASALTERWGFLPLSLRYAIAYDAIRRARPDAEHADAPATEVEHLRAMRAEIDDRMVERNQHLAERIADGTAVPDLDEVMALVRGMGEAYLDAPGPLAVQLVDEIERLRTQRDEARDECPEGSES